MKEAVLRFWNAAFWRMVRLGHRADFGWFLPFIARMPLPAAYALSGVRGRINAMTRRDWRSVALGSRHIHRQSLAGYELLPEIGATDGKTRWGKQRFESEARDEFEAGLVAAGRLRELTFEFVPLIPASLRANRESGLVLLTPHFDSFYLGIAFLAQAMGSRVNSMSSAVARDPRVEPSVTQHFERKYRGLERYLNGGKVLDMEVGIRPFYRMLEQNETLVVLADAPVLPNGVAMTVDFLGARRVLAGGALRMARRTNSDLGGYVCRFKGHGRYEIEMCRIGPANDPQTITRIYKFFSDQILARPGLWWAADMLPNLPPAGDGLRHNGTSNDLD
jgi:lauroyl/myristoyl acyltransferase